MNLLGEYQNGNYKVQIYEDGTKIRQTLDYDADDFYPDFAESIDCKITDYCDMNCMFCHEGSSQHGKAADIMNEKFIDTLRPYTELAIGGGNPLSHPDLIPFLEKLKEKKVIANLTVNQWHFENNQKLIETLVDKSLIYGLGVSMNNPTDRFIDLMQEYPDAVVHVINGVVEFDELEKLYDKGLKLLILGYKDFRRGRNFHNQVKDDIENNQRILRDNIFDVSNHFKVTAFDNLAIEQLDICDRFYCKDDWDKLYMGDDGHFTFYIDMVDRKFAVNSTTKISDRHDLMDSADDMFKAVRRSN